MNDVQKAYAITDAKISFVSLVDKAANKRNFLITKQENGQATFSTYGRIVKTDVANHYITGIVYEVSRLAREWIEMPFRRSEERK